MLATINNFNSYKISGDRNIFTFITGGEYEYLVT